MNQREEKRIKKICICLTEKEYQALKEIKLFHKIKYSKIVRDGIHFAIEYYK